MEKLNNDVKANNTIVSINDDLFGLFILEKSCFQETVIIVWDSVFCHIIFKLLLKNCHFMAEK